MSTLHLDNTVYNVCKQIRVHYGDKLAMEAGKVIRNDEYLCKRFSDELVEPTFWCIQSRLSQVWGRDNQGEVSLSGEGYSRKVKVVLLSCLLRMEGKRIGLHSKYICTHEEDPKDTGVRLYQLEGLPFSQAVQVVRDNDKAYNVPSTGKVGTEIGVCEPGISRVYRQEVPSSKGTELYRTQGDAMDALEYKLKGIVERFHSDTRGRYSLIGSVVLCLFEYSSTDGYESISRTIDVSNTSWG